MSLASWPPRKDPEEAERLIPGITGIKPNRQRGDEDEFIPANQGVPLDPRAHPPDYAVGGGGRALPDPTRRSAGTRTLDDHVDAVAHAAAELDAAAKSKGAADSRYAEARRALGDARDELRRYVDGRVRDRLAADPRSTRTEYEYAAAADERDKDADTPESPYAGA